MVKIVNGNKENIVSFSAYNNFFKSQGWTIAGEGDTPPDPIKEVEKVVEVEEHVGADETATDEEWDEILDELQDEEVEKPLSDMNKMELTEKAKSLGIDVTNLNTNKQLREAIKSHK